MRKRAFVLGGGGAKGAFQVGVLNALTSAGITPDICYGASVGALNASGYAYLGSEGLGKVWRGIRGNKDIIKFRWRTLVGFSNNIYSTKPLKKMIDSFIKSDPSYCGCYACKVNIETGQIRYAHHSETNFNDSVLASAAIPVIMPPVGPWVDGGVREITPLKKAIQDGAEEIIVILCSPLRVNPEPWKSPKGLIRMAKRLSRTIDIMSHEIFFNDLARCMEYNKRDDKKKIALRLYYPNEPLGDSLDFSPTAIRRMIKLGEAADNKLANFAMATSRADKVK